MLKKLLLLNLYLGGVVADNYISNNNYIQNPFNGQPSGGGTQVVQESKTLDQNVWQKWFENGTYNVQAAMSADTITNNNFNFAYGTNIFAQTGVVAGFSFGGNLAIVNPYFSQQINGTDPATINLFLPPNQVVFPNELFTEYKIPNLFQADAGWLYINTPWVTSYDPLALQQPTYQGVLLNYQMTQNILWTGMALNGFMPVSAIGFSGTTLYNQNYDFGTQTPTIHNLPSTGTIALGMQYGQNLSWKANVWGYQFQDYVDMLYADTKYTLAINPKTNLTFAAQGAIEGTNFIGNSGTNNFATSGYGTPQSNMVGLQFGVNYDWLGVLVSYNNVFGNPNGYEGGGLVSPYTYQLATDPLYTTGILAGLVEKSAGSAVKIAPTFTFFSNSLTISPSYEQFWTNPYPNTTEWDLNLTYNLPQVKGLTFSEAFGYLSQPPSTGGSVTFDQVMVSYVY
jgi:hypothetical protein